MQQIICGDGGWVNIREAAAHLGMSTAFLRKRVRQGTIPFTRLGNKSLRFRKSDLDRWAEAHGCDSRERNS